MEERRRQGDGGEEWCYGRQGGGYREAEATKCEIQWDAGWEPAPGHPEEGGRQGGGVGLIKNADDDPALFLGQFGHELRGYGTFRMRKVRAVGLGLKYNFEIELTYFFESWQSHDYVNTVKLDTRNVSQDISTD
jgi:hypothetical protein